MNKNSFDYNKQVEAIWEKTERAVTEKKWEKARTLCVKGKALVKKRLKVLKYANKEGWDAALEYMSDDLADDEADRKRMQKAKKKAEKSGKEKKEKQESRKRLLTLSRKQSEGYKKYPDESTRYEWRESRTCWKCGSRGHLSKNCRRR